MNTAAVATAAAAAPAAAPSAPAAPAGSPAERRAFVRKVLRVSAVAHVPGMAVTVRTADISLGGLGIVAPANPPPGMMLELEMVLPSRNGGGGRPMRFKARVMNSVYSRDAGGFRVGLAFVGLDPRMAILVADYIK